MAAIASEFRRTLIGARVDKIYQPSRLELVMTMRQPGRSITIIASAQPTAARVHITETVRENPTCILHAVKEVPYRFQG